MKKSVAVLGLGRFGKSLAESLYNMGADVLAVDCSEEVVQSFAGKCTSAVCADLTNEEEVEALGLKNMDIVVIAVSNDLAASVVSIAVAKEQGVPVIVAKTASERMSTVLRKLGADQILDPEGEGGARWAPILLSAAVKDFYELDENMYMVEFVPKEEWVGKTLVELDLRSRMNINVVAERVDGGLWHFVFPDKPITPRTILLIVVEKQNIAKLW